MKAVILLNAGTKVRATAPNNSFKPKTNRYAIVFGLIQALGPKEAMRFSDALKQDDPAYEIFNAALDAVFDEGDGVTEHIDRLTDEARLVYLLWRLDGEVHNGGFDQLFTNSLGNHCLEILRHLEVVGATNSHSLLARAVSWFPDSSPSRNRTERWSQHESFSDNPEYQAEMDRLDTEFYEYKDNLESLVNAYVARHPDASVMA